MSATPTPRQPAARRPPRRAGTGLALLFALAASAGRLPGAGADALAAERASAGPSAPGPSAPGSVFSGARRPEWRTDPLAMFRLYSANGLIDPGLALESLRPGGNVAIRPITARNMDPLARRLLASSFPLALQYLSASPTCRTLYEGLGTGGLLVLSTTVYLSPGSEETRSLCVALHANAYTRVGQQTTIVCPAFAQLSRSRAAVTLLHEALHYAGMTERPGDPAALSSTEITELVGVRCAP